MTFGAHGPRNASFSDTFRNWYAPRKYHAGFT